MPLRIEPVVFLNRDQTVRLSCDELQWILEKGQPSRKVPGRDSGYRGVSYVMTEKRILLRCIREKNLRIDIWGHCVLAVLHDNFSEFRAEWQRYGMTNVRRRIHYMAKTASPLPEGYVTLGGGCCIETA